MPGGDIGPGGPDQAAVQYEIQGKVAGAILFQDGAVGDAFRRGREDGAWMRRETGTVHIELVPFVVLRDLCQDALFPRNQAASFMFDSLAEFLAPGLAPCDLILASRSVPLSDCLEFGNFLALHQLPRLLLDERLEAKAPKAALEAHELRTSRNYWPGAVNEHQVFRQFGAKMVAG